MFCQKKKWIFFEFLIFNFYFKIFLVTKWDKKICHFSVSDNFLNTRQFVALYRK